MAIGDIDDTLPLLHRSNNHPRVTKFEILEPIFFAPSNRSTCYDFSGLGAEITARFSAPPREKTPRETWRGGQYPKWH